MKGYANVAIAALRLLLLAVVFASLWIRFVAMADDNRVNDSGQACMGAFLVYVLTLVGDADRSIWIMLFRRSIMLSCIFVLTAITAVDNTLNIITVEPSHNYGKRVSADVFFVFPSLFFVRKEGVFFPVCSIGVRKEGDG